jgi:alpha-ribazole phosphatase
MPAVDFLRHGAIERLGAMPGETDLRLSAEGRAAIARQSAGRTWAAIVASPLRRAQESAMIAAAGGGTAIGTDPAWVEIDLGDWKARSRSELASDPAAAEFYADPEAGTPPNGETVAAARHRVRGALESLAERQGPLLVVAHAGVIRIALSVLLDLPLERLWSLRINYGTRVGVDMGRDPVHGLWGEIVEIVQPQ